MKITVSVIMPCFNQSEFIGETLDCLIKQTYSNWECIIVNDGSTDNSEEICRSYTEKEKRIKLFTVENEGPSKARNFAISKSIGEYLLPLDSDDLISPSYIEACVSILNKQKDLKLVYCNAELFGQLTGKWELPSYSFENLLFFNMIFCSAMFRRSDFDKTKGFEPKMIGGLEDWEFWIELLKTGGNVYKIPETHFYYRIKDNSRNISITKELEGKLKTQIYINHFDLYVNKFGDPITIIQEKKKYKDFYIKVLSSRTYIYSKIVNNSLNKIKKSLANLNFQSFIKK